MNVRGWYFKTVLQLRVMEHCKFSDAQLYVFNLASSVHTSNLAYQLLSNFDWKSISLKLHKIKQI
jgi:hypothetical protein